MADLGGCAFHSFFHAAPFRSLAGKPRSGEKAWDTSAQQRESRIFRSLLCMAGLLAKSVRTSDGRRERRESSARALDAQITSPALTSAPLP